MASLVLLVALCYQGAALAKGVVPGERARAGTLPEARPGGGSATSSLPPPGLSDPAYQRLQVQAKHLLRGLDGLPPPGQAPAGGFEAARATTLGADPERSGEEPPAGVAPDPRFPLPRRIREVASRQRPATSGGGDDGGTVTDAAPTSDAAGATPWPAPFTRLAQAVGKQPPKAPTPPLEATQQARPKLAEPTPAQQELLGRYQAERRVEQERRAAAVEVMRRAVEDPETGTFSFPTEERIGTRIIPANEPFRIGSEKGEKGVVLHGRVYDAQGRYVPELSLSPDEQREPQPDAQGIVYYPDHPGGLWKFTQPVPMGNGRVIQPGSFVIGGKVDPKDGQFKGGKAFGPSGELLFELPPIPAEGPVAPAEAPAPSKETGSGSKGRGSSRRGRSSSVEPADDPTIAAEAPDPLAPLADRQDPLGHGPAVTAGTDPFAGNAFLVSEDAWTAPEDPAGLAAGEVDATVLDAGRPGAERAGGALLGASLEPDAFSLDPGEPDATVGDGGDAVTDAVSDGGGGSGSVFSVDAVATDLGGGGYG